LYSILLSSAYYWYDYYNYLYFIAYHYYCYYSYLYSYHYHNQPGGPFGQATLAARIGRPCVCPGDNNMPHNNNNNMI